MTRSLLYYPREKSPILCDFLSAGEQSKFEESIKGYPKKVITGKDIILLAKEASSI